MVDQVGTQFAGGGMNASLRDMARFGEAMRNNGRFNGQQIVPEAGWLISVPVATRPSLPAPATPRCRLELPQHVVGG
ncbi:hypothetical protein ULF88_13300 [Halopseudomonas pachastrellae]|nr:hypothetical protein [Halopseudomonas pachastrellae]